MKHLLTLVLALGSFAAVSCSSQPSADVVATDGITMEITGLT